MRRKYVSVLIVHVLNVHLGVWSAGVEKTIYHIPLCVVYYTLFCVWCARQVHQVTWFYQVCALGETSTRDVG